MGKSHHVLINGTWFAPVLYGLTLTERRKNSALVPLIRLSEYIDQLGDAGTF